MTRPKRTAKRVRGQLNKRDATTLKEAIEKRQKSFNGKKILYLNTVFYTGVHKDESVEQVIRKTPRYIQFLSSTTGVYVTDEVIERLKQVIQI